MKIEKNVKIIKTSCSPGTLSSELVDGEQSETLITGEEMVSDLLNYLDICKSLRLDGIHPKVLRELSKVLTKTLSIIYRQSCLSGGSPSQLSASKHDARLEGVSGKLQAY